MLRLSQLLLMLTKIFIQLAIFVALQILILAPETYNLSTDFTYGNTFICKLDASGKFLWAKHFRGDGSASGSSIAVDANGNVYTTGLFFGTADFDPGSEIYNLISNGYYTADVFVSKLDASGNFLWAKRMGGTADYAGDNGTSIAVDVNGNVYTAGYFFGTADFDPGSGTYNLTSLGEYDGFVFKLDASGNFLWAKQFGQSLSDMGTCVAVDANGNVYTTGYFSGSPDFDPGPGTYSMPAAGYSDVFVSKLDASGNFLWAKQLGGMNDDVGYAIAVDINGNVFTTGRFHGTADFDPGPSTYNLTPDDSYDIFVSKLDNSGNFLWAKQMNGEIHYEGNRVHPKLSHLSCLFQIGMLKVCFN